MRNIFDQLFRYGFHETVISSISKNGQEIGFNFNEGIYLLDENGKETILSSPVQMVLRINSRYDSTEKVFEVEEHGTKKHIDYLSLKEYIAKNGFEISTVYYSNSENILMFESGLHYVILYIWGIDQIAIHELSTAYKVSNQSIQSDKINSTATFQSAIEFKTCNIFDQLFQYKFNGTEISSISDKGEKISLSFNKGICLLDENGKESILSSPVQMVLKVDSIYDSLEPSFDILEYGKKLKYVNYASLKKHFEKDVFKISEVYYSGFENVILFDGRFRNKRVSFSVSVVEPIVVCKL